MKILKTFLTIVLLLSLSFVLNVNAAPTVNFDSETIKSYTDIETTDLGGVATLNQTTITSYNNRIIDNSKLASHVSYWIEPNVSLQDSDLRIVNYTAGTKTMWQGKKPTDLATIYERENPGWIVIGGINGDFFWITDNCEVLGTSMQEGDFYKACDYDEGGHKAIGFKDDGTYVHGTVDASKKQYLQILGEDGKYVNVKQIEKIDAAPSNEGITLLTRFAACPSPFANVSFVGDLPYDLTGYTIYKVVYDVQRFDRDGSNKAGENRVFVKGTIAEVINDVKTLTIDDADNASYLVSKDGSLDSLKVGDYVRCQCITQGKWEGVTNISSAYNQILTNGEVIDYDNVTDVDTGYINAIKNRTIMGFKADGTPIMMVVEKGGYGASYEECGEILKGLGCVEGFLFDGGGSSCIFIRNEYGGFTTLNKHEDGRERSDGNAVLLVKRDPGFDVDIDNIERFQAKVNLNITNVEFFKDVSNIKITLNGETKAYDEKGVLFTNLDENTKYDVKVSYEINKTPGYSNKVSSIEAKQFTTKNFEYPAHGLSIHDINGTSFKVVRDKSLPNASWIKDVVVYVDNTPYNLGNEDSIVCDNLRKDSTYQVKYNYKVLDPESGKTYDVESEVIEVTTLKYVIPKIVKFEESMKTASALAIKYEYKDEDSTVESAYILYNENRHELTVKNGTATITGLDFDNNSYEFKLVLEYKNAAGRIETIESDILSYEQTGNNSGSSNQGGSQTGSGCGFGAATLVTSLLSATALLGIVFRKRR